VAFDVFDLSKATPIPPGIRDRSWKEREIPNKMDFTNEFDANKLINTPDPVRQDYNSAERTTATIGVNFQGQTNVSGVAPPDTDGDVSPNYYMQMVNLAFQIFDRQGNSLYGPYDNSTLWSGFPGPWAGTNDGDPIVLYDQYADRWIATQFALPYSNGPYYELIAVSATNDPRGAWFRYAYEFTYMPDYPKFGVWPDGYYMTINQFGRIGFRGGAVAVFNREQMLGGISTAPMQFFNLGTSYASLLPADADGVATPPTGSPNYLVTLGSSALRILQASINWETPSSSSISLISTLPVATFSTSVTINQPGTSQTLDNLSDRLMYRLQYRKFADREVMVTNHTVNAGNGQAGVRWYELRKTGSSWSVYQQGTYAPADGTDRWMGSVAMNGNGDIAVGYSASSTSVYPSIRFAGRTANSTEPLGVLDVPEVTIHSGNASQTGVNRWGDYSMMSVDPINDFTFWFTSEYSTGGWNWRTKIASIDIGTPAGGSAPVADFTGAPLSITAGQSVQFTDNSINNPTSWSWSFSGGTPSTSNQQNPSVTYAAAGSYNVTLTATNASGSNTITKNNYITVTSATAPQAAFSVSDNTILAGETVTFTDQSTGSPTSWAWTFSGGTPSTSNLQNPPAIQFNLPGTYNVTLVAGNSGGSTSASAQIQVGIASYCSSNSTSTAYTDYISQVSHLGVDYVSNPQKSNYYLFANGPTFTANSPVTLTLTPGSTSRKEYWRIWIDYNQNGLFTDAGEQVFAINNARKIVTASFLVPGNYTGTTRMRISMKYGAAPGPCETFTNGEVEDYTINIVPTASPVRNYATGNLTLDLYPNPTNGILNVRTNSESAKNQNQVVQSDGCCA